MAEDRNNSQGLVGQAHAAEHGSPPPQASTVSAGLGIGTAVVGVAGVARTGVIQRNESPPRGPRTLSLRRGENGFGFTLRHFIVYPPEACCVSETTNRANLMIRTLHPRFAQPASLPPNINFPQMLPGHERKRIDEPMDTIFVKQVRGNSPAAEAGLRTGDRVVSVDGRPTRGEQYAKVVQRIQQAGPILRLLVVSKEDDILQRYFGETAHNPETNQRPRLRSPERNFQKQRRSASMIPGLSPKTRQSWVCSGQTSMPATLGMDRELDRSVEDGVPSRSLEIRSSELSKEIPQTRGTNGHTYSQSQPTRNVMYHCKPSQELSSRHESLDEKLRLRNPQQHFTKNTSSLIRMQQSSDALIQPDPKCDKHDVLYDRTRSESIYSRSNSDQIYDKIKDPIYERVKLSDTARASLEERYHHHHHHHHPQQQQQQQQYYQTCEQKHSNLPRYPLSRAEPQVPIYRPAARRVTSRRASEGSTSSSTKNNFETASYVSADALRSYEPGSRFSIDSRRDSSPIHGNDTSSYDSNPPFLASANNVIDRNERRDGNICGYRVNNGNIGSTNIDDSVIMTRLRKSFEQKEEFLRRPNHPIGWLMPEERPESPVQNNDSAATIPREFYARPQKFQKQIWPPTDSKPDQQAVCTRVCAQDSGKNCSAKLISDKVSSNENVRWMKSSSGTGAETMYSRDRNDQVGDCSGTVHSSEYAHQQVVGSINYRLDKSSSVYDDRRDSFEFKEKEDRHQQQLQRSVGKSSNFIGTLSRIHENITAVGGLAWSERQSDPRNDGASSLPSSPGLEKKVNDKFPLLPQGLQIVSKRAKQFESGRLLSDDDEPTGDRTNLYKSELSRLSNKRSVPNVAVRKREFESKAEAQEPRRTTIMPARETKSLDTGSGLKGNRIIPVGSRRIHCKPPDGYETLEADSQHSRINESETLRRRIRSNSVESWDSASVSNCSEIEGHQWAQPQQDDGERKRDTKGGDDNVYVNMMGSGNGNDRIREKPTRRSQHDGYVPIAEADHGVQQTQSNVHGNAVVFRRQKKTQIADEERVTRRESYLKATWGERYSDLGLSDSEPIIHTSRSLHKRWRLPLLPNDIASLRRIFEEVTQSTSLNRNINRGNATCPGLEAASAIAKEVEQVEREGPLHVKFTLLDGKRSSDRSWKQVWGVLRGPILFFYKDRQNQSPSVVSDGEHVTQNVDVRCSLVDIAEDYTKRKHVLRLANPHAEVLLQTEDAASMAVWLRALHEHAAAEKPSEITHNSTLKQQAVPQTPGPNSTTSTCQTLMNTNMVITVSSGNSGCGVSGGQRLSPLPGHKGIKKLTSFRNRSPTGQSPINKTRKPSQTIDSLVSPKTKTWKGRVAKQLRRMHGQTGSASSPVTQLPPEGATFKVPLELCPSSSFSEYVPLIVEMCTSIVEARGLEVVGIYRVPGNTAAISHLTESVNKGFENINHQDPRWSDVNVISSLLKSFFRQLPDSLLTAELYPMFIDADKVEDPQRRMTTIRKLLRDLPEHHFETLKYLMFHLKRIVEHSEVNKMEAKNLAIVFGPTLVRASGSRDNMVTMVTDMSHQCRIVESLLNNVDWFFSDDDLDDLSRLSVNLSLPADTSEIETTTSSNNHNLLLNNIQKVEGVREMASAKDIVSSIISAANRKIQRRRKGQDEAENENHEIDKSRGKPESESLANRRSMALNERQCSVNEIVLMHENKHQLNRSINRSPTVDGNPVTDTSAISDVTVCMANNRDLISNPESVRADKSVKYRNSTVESIQSIQPSPRSAVSSASESSRLSSETGLSCFDASSSLSSASNDTKQSNDEIAIRTYTGLSATTQERIRRFEQETKAMLQRDQNRQRREAERREEERRRIEVELQLAKREMENDDLLDSIVDNAVTTTAYHPSTNRLSTVNATDKTFLDITSRSASRIPPLSIAVQQEPTSIQSTVLKKMKTEREVSSESSSLPPIRYGSFDSLHEAHEVSQSSFSPTSQQRKPLSSDVSDDGSDLLTSLATTFDRKWRSLVSSSSQSVGGPTMENVSLNDKDTPSTRDSQNMQHSQAVLRDVKGEESITTIQPVESCSLETYRDPSLHKTTIDKRQYVCPKNDAPEKDTDSSVTENVDIDRLDTDTPDNDRSAFTCRLIESKMGPQLCSSKDTVDESVKVKDAEDRYKVEKDEIVLMRNGKATDEAKGVGHSDVDSGYSNKLEKFESLTNLEVRSRLKRSESLNKRSDSTSSKLKRSESLNKHSAERLSSPTNGKLKRSESLNKHSDRSDSPNSKLKRSESLTKTEKTESNISKRRQSVRKDSATKLKRKNGMPERSIKRRHTVGGTKDFDKVHWLDNKLQVEAEKVVRNEYRPKKSQLRTSSPDLSTGRIGLSDASFLIEVSFRGPSNVVFNVTNTRPQSLPDTSLASKVFKVPLESHV